MVLFSHREGPGGNEKELYQKMNERLQKIQNELAGNIDFKKQDNTLSKGHLTANSDFVFAPLKHATYYFYNVAPQWQAFNAFNWAAVELAVRKYVNARGSDVRVYTGVYVSCCLKYEFS